MIQKIISLTVFMCLMLSSNVYAQTAKAPVTEKSVTKAAPVKTAPAEKPVTKAPEEDKYPAVYAKCTKEAEQDETKYDQIFDNCMDKNGFPPEQFNSGGLPIDSGEDE